MTPYAMWMRPADTCARGTTAEWPRVGGPAKAARIARRLARPRPAGRQADYGHDRRRLAAGVGGAGRAGAPRPQRRLARACAARRLHRPNARHAAGLAGRVRARLRGARRSARPLRRCHGRAADAERTPGRAPRRASRAGRRHGAGRDRLRAGGPVRRASRLVRGAGSVGRRLRHAASARLGGRRPCLWRRRARPARRLQLRRRPRQGGPAGARRAAPHLHAVASGPVAARPRRSPYRRGRVGDGAALRRRRAGRPRSPLAAPAAAASVSSSPSA